MKKTRRKFSSEFKVKVALDALKERHTLSELAQKYGLQPQQDQQWKRSKNVFCERPKKRAGKQEIHNEPLYSKIGYLEMECNF